MADKKYASSAAFNIIAWPVSSSSKILSPSLAAVFYDFTNTSYFISVINETAGSDGAVHVEEVSQGNPVAS